MSGHIHAELMAQYAEDARETERPWERWEKKSREGWFSISDHPLWFIDAHYRRKPRTITINGREVPEPMRSAPAIGSRYYLASTSFEHLFSSEGWYGDESDQRWLSRGLVHSTEEAAISHAEALLSFTEAE